MEKTKFKKKAIKLHEDTQNLSYLIRLADGNTAVCHMKQVTVRGVPADTCGASESNNNFDNSSYNHNRNNTKAIQNFSTIQETPKEKRIKKNSSNEQCGGNDPPNIHRMTSVDRPCSQGRPLAPGCNHSKSLPQEKENCGVHTEHVRHLSEHHTQPAILTQQQPNTNHQQYAQNIAAGNYSHINSPLTVEALKVNQMTDGSSGQNFRSTTNVPYLQRPSLILDRAPDNAHENLIHDLSLHCTQSNIQFNSNHSFHQPQIPGPIHKPLMASISYQPPQMANPLYQPQFSRPSYQSIPMSGFLYQPTQKAGPSYHVTDKVEPFYQPQMAGHSAYPSHASCDIPHIYHFNPYCCGSMLANILLPQQTWNANTVPHCVHCTIPNIKNVFAASADHDKSRYKFQNTHENNRRHDMQSPRRSQMTSHGSHSDLPQKKNEGREHYTTVFPLSKPPAFEIEIN